MEKNLSRKCYYFLGALVLVVILFLLLRGRTADFFTITAVDGVSAAGEENYQASFLAGAFHRFTYTIVNPEEESIDGLALFIDAPEGVRITELAGLNGGPSFDAQTREVNGRMITVFPPDVLNGGERRSFSARLEVDESMAVGVYSLKVTARYYAGGDERRVKQNIPIAIADISFTPLSEKRTSAAVLSHPVGELNLAVDWRMRAVSNIASPRDAYDTLAIAQNDFISSLGDGAVTYAVGDGWGSESLAEAAALLGRSVGQQYAAGRLRDIFEKIPGVSPVLELAMTDTLMEHLFVDGRRLVWEVAKNYTADNGTISLASLGAAAPLSFGEGDFEGLFDAGFIDIAKSSVDAIQVDVGKYLQAYSVPSVVGFLYARNARTFLVERFEGDTALFDVPLAFTNYSGGEGPWRVAVVLKERPASERQTSNVLTVPRISAKDISASEEILGELVGVYRADDGAAFGKKHEALRVADTTFATERTLSGFELFLMPSDEALPQSRAVDEVEVVDSRVANGETAFTVRLGAAEEHTFYIEGIAYRTNAQRGVSEKYYRVDTDKQTVAAGASATFKVVFPGIFGEDFDSFRLHVHSNPLPAIVVMIGTWIGHAKTAYDYASLAYDHTKPGVARIEILEPETGGSADVGDLIRIEWRWRAEVPGMGFWVHDEQYITFDVLIDDESIFGKRMRVPPSIGGRRSWDDPNAVLFHGKHVENFLTPGSYELGAPLFISAERWECGGKNSITVRVEADVRNLDGFLDTIGPETYVTEDMLATAPPREVEISVNNPFSGEVVDLSHPHHENAEEIEKVTIRARRVEGGRIDRIPPDTCTYVIDNITVTDPHGSAKTPDPVVKSCPQTDTTIFNIPVSFVGEESHHSPHDTFTYGGSEVDAHVKGVVPERTAKGIIAGGEPWTVKVRKGGSECFPREYEIVDIDKGGGDGVVEPPQDDTDEQPVRTVPRTVPRRDLPSPPQPPEEDKEETASGAAAPKVKTLTINPENPAIDAKTIQRFTAIGIYDDGVVKDVTLLVAWTTNDDAVATIDAGGRATAHAGGLVTVMAEIDGVAAETTLNVSGPPPPEPVESTTSTSESPSEPVNLVPTIDGIDVSQLHEFDEQLPHRYSLAATASDPEGGVLTYNWSVDCGYFFVSETNTGGTFSGLQSSVEWRYDVYGECSNAAVSVTATDPEGAADSFSHSIFE